MSLRRHVCRLHRQLQKPGDHIWISEDALDNAIQSFFSSRCSRRHVSFAPGPLEARKRATKRRMMNLAQAGGGDGLDPSLYNGVGGMAEKGWQWQSPTEASAQNEKKPLWLPRWLTQAETTDHDEQSPEILVQKKAVPKLQPQITEETRANSEEHLNYIKDLKSCQDLAALRSWASKHKIKLDLYSRPAFRQLYNTGQKLEMMLEALDYTPLNRDGNLVYVLDRLKEKALTSHDTRVLEQWLKRTLSSGQRSWTQASLLARFVLHLGVVDDDEHLKCGLVESMFEGFQSSTSLGIGRLRIETIETILQAITHGKFSRMSQDLGFRVIQALSPVQTSRLIKVISRFLQTQIAAQATMARSNDKGTSYVDAIPRSFEILRSFQSTTSLAVAMQTSQALIEHATCLPLSDTAWRHSMCQWWYLLRHHYLVESRDTSGNMRKLEQMLIERPLVVRVTYLQNLDDSEIAHFILYWEFLHRSQAWVQVPAFECYHQMCKANPDRSPFVSMLRVAHEYCEVPEASIQRIFRLLQILQKSNCILDIIVGLRNADIRINERVVLETIRAGLRWRHFQAEALFSIYQELPLESCPELAERMIGNIKRHPSEALKHYVARHPGVIAGCREPMTTIQARAQLLQRMALAYSAATHLTFKMTFLYVYKCYLYHMRENLGPLSTAMVHAITKAGIILPLQRGQWVSTMRIKWILRLVRRVEGSKVADKIDRAVYEWRGIVVKKIQAEWQRRKRARYGLRESPMSFSVRSCWNSRQGRVDRVLKPLKYEIVGQPDPCKRSVDAP